MSRPRGVQTGSMPGRRARCGSGSLMLRWLLDPPQDACIYELDVVFLVPRELVFSTAPAGAERASAEPREHGTRTRVSTVWLTLIPCLRRKLCGYLYVPRPRPTAISRPTANLQTLTDLNRLERPEYQVTATVTDLNPRNRHRNRPGSHQASPAVTDIVCLRGVLNPTWFRWVDLGRAEY